VSRADGTRPVRPGEELDPAALAALLEVPAVEVEQFSAGYSNLTYLLRAGDRELVLRRPPAGAKAITAGHDMGREYRLLAALQGRYPVPAPVLFVPADRSITGTDFYVMERVPGLILRRRVPEGVDLGPQRMGGLSSTFVDRLVELHAVDVRAPGIAELGRPEGYVRRQVEGWTARWEKARTQDIPDMDRAAGWLAGHLPPEAPGALIHNDFKFDNLVLDPATLQVRAVLDWEMATLGDPLSDLGMALAYWVEPGDPDDVLLLAQGLTAQPGAWSRREVAEAYAERSGRSLAHLRFHRVLGLFKVAVIAQQIHARYARGLTTDERFAVLLLAVQVLSREAVREAGG
jgi:aminoglycoside phosphotransferase (APT) family kinase protein